MNLDYVPLLKVQRELHDIPRDEQVNGKPKRFLEYLRKISTADGTGLELPPLVGINPMAKDHVTRLLDALLAIDADGIAARTTIEASALLANVPGDCKATLVVVDDWMGWSQRAPYEFDCRFPGGLPESLPRWTKHSWATAILWSSESASAKTVREVMLTMAHRLAYVHWHGPARTLRDRLAQEGRVMASAGCISPVLDDDDIAYSREVIRSFLEADDKRTVMECLFGDDASRALGFTPRGLSPWAGIALALHDARIEGAR